MNIRVYMFLNDIQINMIKLRKKKSSNIPNKRKCLEQNYLDLFSPV